MTKTILASLFALALPIANADSIDKLLTITNDRDTDSSVLALSLDSHNEVVGLNYITTSEGKTAEKDFKLSDLATATGAVLEEQQGVKAIELTGHVDEKAGTGALVIHYIYNGLSGTYKTCNLNVQRGSDNVWSAINAYTHKPVTTAKVITYAIGIQTIQGVCP